MKPVSSSFILALVCLLLVNGCAGALPTGGGGSASTVTSDPNSTLTPTPFQPEVGTPTATPLPSLTPTPTNTATPIPATRMPAGTGERASYVLVVDLDYAASHLSVQEGIHYPNQTGTRLDSLVLAVEANRWLGAFDLIKVKVDGVETSHYSLQSGRMDLTLEKPLEAGQATRIEISYNLTLPWNGSDQIFGYNNWQANLVDWYPFVVPWSPTDGWLIHDPADVGEHLVYDSVDFDVTLHQANPSLGLVVAASAPAENVNGDLHYRLEAARTFVFSASPDFQSVSSSQDGITITSYFAAGHEKAGQAVLNAVVKAVQTYGQVYAPYPHASLNIVEAFYLDGMEYDGLVFLSRGFYDAYDGSLLNNLVMIGVHEVAHQWFFGLVGNDQALEPWLDEALCTYSEEIFYEHASPGLVGYWWDFRVNDFQPAGKVDITIYQGGLFRPYTNAVYLRGAKMLANLRTRMGDEAFLAFLKDYTAQFSHQRATAADFFRILYSHTTADISDIVATYFQNPH